MKCYFRTAAFLVFIAAILSSCNPPTPPGEKDIPADVVYNPNTADPGNKDNRLPAFLFEQTEHDFGRIIDGATVSFQFKFVNSGKSDLIIAEVTTSCGCTVPTYPKAPVPPGGEGVIKVAFNSKGRRGFQTKNIVVVANTQPNVTKLVIKAQVVGPNEMK